MLSEGPSHRLSNRAFCILLFLLCFAVYNSNLHLIPSPDSDATKVLPLCIILDGDVYLDRFAAQWINTYWGSHPHSVTYRRGHWISLYPIVTPILITPLYVPLAWWIHRYNPPLDSVLVIRLVSLMEKISASIIAALSAVFLYLCLFQLSGHRRATAMALTLVYAFASNMWVIGSQALWLHAMTALLVSLGLWLLLIADSRPSMLFGSGAAIALATANRPPAAVLAALLEIYVLMRYRSRSWSFFLTSATIAIAYFVYNIYFFGTFTGAFTAGSGWTTPIPVGLTGLLFNPSRGLLIYTPWTIFGFAGAAAVLFSRRGFTLPTCLALAAFGELVLYSKWWCWWGGSCFGPRLLTDILPLLTILLLPVMDSLDARVLLKFAFALTVLVSFGVQIIGAYCAFPWELQEGKFWSWRDSQLVEAIREHQLIVWSPRNSGLLGDLHQSPDAPTSTSEY